MYLVSIMLTIEYDYLGEYGPYAIPSEIMPYVASIL